MSAANHPLIPIHPGDTAMTLYATLDAALDAIAARSFYESATVTPVDNGYTLEDDHGTAWAADGIGWTYADGMDIPSRALDHSRLHDPAETYTTAAHIRYNLSDAVMALAEGRVVTFAYDVVNDTSLERDEDGNTVDEDGELTDDIAGWVLLAFEVTA